MKAKAKYITEVTVTDPDSDSPVEVAIYKCERTGGMFGIDSSFISQEDPEEVPSPFQPGIALELVGD
jgi:hypothetical protein